MRDERMAGCLVSCTFWIMVLRGSNGAGLIDWRNCMRIGLLVGVWGIVYSVLRCSIGSMSI